MKPYKNIATMKIDESWRALIGVVFTLFVFVLVGVLSANLGDSSEFIVLFAYVLTYTFLSIVILLSLDKPFLLNPAFLFWGAYTLLIGIGAPIYLNSDSNLGSADNLLGIVLGGLLCFAIGCLIPLMGQTKNKVVAGTKTFFDLADYKVVLLAVAALAVSAGLFYIVKNFGSLFGSGTYNSSRIEAQSGQGFFLYLNGSLVVVCPLLFQLFLKGHLSKWPCFFFTIVGIVIFLLRGSRTAVMVTIVLMVLAYRSEHEIKKSIYAVIGLAAILFLAAYAMLRSGSGTLISNLKSLFTVVPLNTEYMLKYFPDRIDFLWGSSYLFNLNILLPGEGQDFTLWLKDQLGLTFSGGGITPGIIGEFYLNFGYPGIFIGMAFLGYVTRSLRSGLLSRSKWSLLIAYVSIQLALSVYGGLSNCLLSLLINSLLYGVLVVGCDRTYMMYCSDAFPKCIDGVSPHCVVRTQAKRSF